ncbi:hypothetical protein [Nonomuraea sp. NPDC003727]
MTGAPDAARPRTLLRRRSLLGGGALTVAGAAATVAVPAAVPAAAASSAAPAGVSAVYAQYVRRETRLRLWTRREGHRWIRYDLQRFTATGISLDAWRLQEVFAVDLSADVPGPGVVETNPARLATPANYEYALSLQGESHIGGMHGFELSRGSLVVLDGRAMSVDELPEYVSAAEFELAQENDLLSRGDRGVVGDLRVRHLVTSAGLRLRWSLTWRQARTVANAYGAMLPADKNAAVSTRCRFMGEAREHDLTVPGRPRADAYGVQMYNRSNGLALSVELTPDFQAGYAHASGSGIWVKTDQPGYNKAYPTRVYPGQLEDVAEGATWRLDATYRFACPA